MTKWEDVLGNLNLALYTIRKKWKVSTTNRFSLVTLLVMVHLHKCFHSLEDLLNNLPIQFSLDTILWAIYNPVERKVRNEFSQNLSASPVFGQ